MWSQRTATSQTWRSPLAGNRTGSAAQLRLDGCFLSPGLHTGQVHVTVELLAAAPPADPSWEEVVECSFSQQANSLLLREWGQEAQYPLCIPQGTYRVRYSARSMLGDWQLTDGDGPMQSYLLQFWAAPPNADLVIKVTGECAKYWHGEVSRQRK